MCAAQHVARLLLHCVDTKKKPPCVGLSFFRARVWSSFFVSRFLDSFFVCFCFDFFCFISVLFIFFVILSDCMNSFHKTRTCRTHHAQSNEIYFFSKNLMT